MNTSQNSNEVLRAENITKSFDGHVVIKDISINLYQNEIVSLLGISGIGKSTLFNVLSGLILPDSGNVYLKNADITGKPGSVSYMHQKDLLLPYKKIIDNVSLPLVIRGESRKNAHLKAKEYLEIFGLSGYESKYPDQLSGGMRQRAALLRTYLFSKETVLLDEPFSALDTITKTKMHSWYLDIAFKLKLSTIFITHDIDEAIMLSDRIYIMTGTPGKITSEIIVDEPKPRSPEFATSESFMKLKKEIIKYF